ncbi:uncharacterized protein L201_002511 [Kwoniella dendrophila CBS 6074]|uniref:Uncharacterized protein n=1 Tax=Kwoniella dendrophila CBS 6074 TaxID=1295534 RepID=A0AAX4JR98_9TREE
MPHKRSKKSVRDAETAKRGSNLPPSAKATTSLYDDTPKSATRIISGWKFQSEFRGSGRTNSEDTGERDKLKIATSKQNTKNGQSSSSAGKVISTEKGKGKEKLPSILPNESLGEYNRRIESILRPGVSKAMKDAESSKQLEISNLLKDKKINKKKSKLEKLIKDGKLPKEALTNFLKEQEQKEKDKLNKRKRNDNDDLDDDDEEEGSENDEEKKRRKPIKEFKEIEKPRRLNDIVQAPPQLPHLRKSSTPKSNTSSKEAYTAIGNNTSRLPLNAGQKRILEEERERVVKMYREMKAQKEVEREKQAKKPKVKA